MAVGLLLLVFLACAQSQATQCPSFQMCLSKSDLPEKENCTCNPDEDMPHISHDTTILLNNSYVDVSNGATLTCHANDGKDWNWYSPSGNRVTSNNNSAIYQEKLLQNQIINLYYDVHGYRNNSEYCCSNGCGIFETSTVCVWLYKGGTVCVNNYISLSGLLIRGISLHIAEYQFLCRSWRYICRKYRN